MLSANSLSASKNEYEVMISMRPTFPEFNPVASQIKRNKPPGFKPSRRPILTKKRVFPLSVSSPRSRLLGERSSRSSPLEAEAFKSPARS